MEELHNSYLNKKMFNYKIIKKKIKRFEITLGFNLKTIFKYLQFNKGRNKSLNRYLGGTLRGLSF